MITIINSRYIQFIAMANKIDQVKEFLDQLNAPNIAVIGLTGVGKSTLINTIFGTEIAPTGSGKPVTTEFKKYSPEVLGINLPVNLYDSPGYEPGTEEPIFVQSTIDFLNQQSRKGKEEQIHLVWYIISASSARLTQADINILTEVNKKLIPAIIVLSQSDRASNRERANVRSAIERTSFNKVYEVIEVASLIIENGQEVYKPFGVKTLLDKTEELLPEIYSEAVVIAQIVDIESKKELAWKYIKQASIGCVAGGIPPVPLSAPASIISALAYMYSKIIAIYGHTKLGLLLGLSGITTGGVLSIITDGIIDSFSLMFPGISILSGTAGGSFALVSGIAFANTCEKLAISNIQGNENEVRTQLRKIFAEEFNKVSKKPALRFSSTSSPEEIIESIETMKLIDIR